MNIVSLFVSIDPFSKEGKWISGYPVRINVPSSWKRIPLSPCALIKTFGLGLKEE